MGIKKKFKYYSLKNIDKLDATYSLIYGERSNGKTTAVLRRIVENYFKDGSEGAYIRRWDLDLQGKRGAAVFDHDKIREDIQRLSNGCYTDVIYKSMRWYLAYPDENGKLTAADTPFCYGFCLNSMQHDKSTNYPRVTTIFFDEFLDKNRYLVDEFSIFLNVLSTIIRLRDNVKIYMAANTVTRYSPYWREMGIHPEKQKQGTIDLYTYGNKNLTVAVEYCASSDAESKPSNKYFEFENSAKLNMITKGGWELDAYPHLTHEMKYLPKEVVYTFFILFNEQMFQCEVVKKSNIQFIYVHQKTSELKNPDTDLIYSLDYDPRHNWVRKITKPFNKKTQKIYNLFSRDKVYYQDNFVGDTVMNYVRQCAKR